MRDLYSDGVIYASYWPRCKGCDRPISPDSPGYADEYCDECLALIEPRPRKTRKETKCHE